MKVIRQSNLELYRIVCMLLIVAHHYVGCFGALDDSGLVMQNTLCANSIFLHLFGMWGKTGINCFVLITGYFMCMSSISIKKFVKLYLWVVFYSIVCTIICMIIGLQTLSWESLLILFPITKIHSDSFTSAFIIWWLFIPFLNILVHNMNRKQHVLLILLMIIVFSIYSFVPKILRINLNPICWFSTIYIIASYIRLYPEYILKSNDTKFWGGGTLLSVIISILSVIVLMYIRHDLNIHSFSPYYFVADSEKPLALLVSIVSFMWFKNLDIKYIPLINTLGAATFGVLLLHTATPIWRDYLWRDLLKCYTFYDLGLFQFMLYSVLIVLLIFIMGAIIDTIRQKTIEKWFFNWYDMKPRFKKLKMIIK